MNLVQKRQLRCYLHFRGRSMSVLALIRFNWWILAIAVAAGVGTVGLMLHVGSAFLAWVFGVAYGAIILKELSLFIRSWLVWPMTSAVIDWAKVEQLAAENGLIE